MRHLKTFEKFNYESINEEENKKILPKSF